MKVTIKLFAGAREAVDADEVEIEGPAELSIHDLRGLLSERYPPLRPLLAHALFAIDASYATDEASVPDGAEVACIPPVSGG